MGAARVTTVTTNSTRAAGLGFPTERIYKPTERHGFLYFVFEVELFEGVKRGFGVVPFMRELSSEELASDLPGIVKYGIELLAGQPPAFVTVDPAGIDINSNDYM